MYARIALVCLLVLLPLSPLQAANLITNGTFEAAGPSGWTHGHWGSNTPVFTHPVAGNPGNAARVTLSSRVSGDAKWAHTPVAVTPGRTYRYTETYTASVPTYVTLQYELAGGGFSYADVLTPPASSSWSPVSVDFTVPENVSRVRVFHLINQNGTVTTDNASLEDVTPPPSGNLVPNPSLESAGSGGLPSSWARGRWGSHNATFTYPVDGFDGTRGAKVDITSYTSGDAKWYFTHAPTDAATLRFVDRYKATVSTQVTAQFKHPNGSYTYVNLGTAPASSNWATFTKTFSVPAGVSVTIFHVLKSVGSLTVDAYELNELAQDPNLFDQGYVSLTFDDGYLSAYQNAIPILNAAGFKSDQFIITERLTNQFPGYVKPAHVLAMQSDGHVIGAHTRTHTALTSLPPAEAQQEIEGSRQDLLAIGATPVDFFAYPTGAYNAQIQQMVKDAGMRAARSSDGGMNDTSTDQYALRRYGISNTTTFTQIKNVIDNARIERKWVILLFHAVDTSGAQYAVTPALFEQVVEYLQSQNTTPITIGEGIDLMND